MEERNEYLPVLGQDQLEAGAGAGAGAGLDPDEDEVEATSADLGPRL